MKKVQRIDFSAERLIPLASSLVEQHNYISALKMLNKNGSMTGNDESSYQLYAEIFDDLGLYEKSINFWYRFIDSIIFADVSDAYEGLAACYMNIGNDRQAAYYYNKLLMRTDDISPDERKDILDSFVQKQEEPLKFVYPPQKADYSQSISRGIELMRKNDYENAIAAFDEVAEGNEKYFEARHYIAMCNIIIDRLDQAEEECVNILNQAPENVQALTTMAAIRTEQERFDESKEIALKLFNIDVKDVNDLYKIATVCCENDLHDEAYTLFCKVEKEITYDCMLLYFKAVSAFNSKRYEESFETFDKLLTIYPRAIAAEFFNDEAHRIFEEGSDEKLSYFYRLPQAERESCVKFLSAYATAKQSEVELLATPTEVTYAAEWCFDEGVPNPATDLQWLGLECAIRARVDDYVRDLLLDAFLSDHLKIRAIESLCKRNEEMRVGLVICHMYKSLTLLPIHLGRTKRKYFIGAYAHLVARFGLIEEENLPRLAVATEEFYRDMERQDKLSLCTDEKLLAVAIYDRAELSGEKLDVATLCNFINVDLSRLNDF